jgi:large subunit ribosomal protein L15
VREQLKKLPKLRGRGRAGLYTIQSKPAIINLSILESMFSAGDVITPAVLRERGAVKARKGAREVVKILGTGDITKKFTITGCKFSASAKQKIEKAGGTIS